MHMTQDHYNEIVTRLDEGRGSDDDARLAALYESEGFQRSDEDGNVPDGLVGKLVITGEAEVIKGEDARPAPKKATRARAKKDGDE